MGIEWKPYFNPFSQAQGFVGYGEKLHYRILPKKKQIALQVFNSYTGEPLRELAYLDLERAQHTVMRIEKDLSVGHEIDEVLDRYKKEDDNH